MQQYNKRVEWKFDDTTFDNNTPLWAVKLFVNGERWGNGRGGSKAAAKNEAAKQGLRRMRR
jgi:ribonuclease-3